MDDLISYSDSKTTDMRTYLNAFIDAKEKRDIVDEEIKNKISE